VVQVVVVVEEPNLSRSRRSESEHFFHIITDFKGPDIFSIIESFPLRRYRERKFQGV
jgi:hypothetical protein